VEAAVGVAGRRRGRHLFRGKWPPWPADFWFILRLFFALRPVVTPAATLYLCVRVFVVNLRIVAADIRRQKS